MANASRKRKLFWHTRKEQSDFEWEAYVKNKKTKVCSKLSTGGLSDEAWARKNEGFAGLNIEELGSKKQLKKPSDSGGNKEQPLSQVSIHWESSDEDETGNHTDLLPRYAETVASSSHTNKSLSESQHVHSKRQTSKVHCDDIKWSDDVKGDNEAVDDGILVHEMKNETVKIVEAISQYDSDRDENLLCVNCTNQDCEICEGVKSQQTGSSISISELSPADNSLPSVGKSEKRRGASDWATQVHQTLASVEKVSQECQSAEETHDVMDSAKKKKKYQKDGLADRLQRLRAREKSAHTFWSHKLKDKMARDWSKILTVKIERMEKKFMLVECECTCESDQLKDKPVTCLFSGQFMTNLAAGSVVHIHPPWQKLSVSGGRVVVLCTHFTEVRSEAVHCGGVEEMGDSHWQTVATWRCPCSRDSSILNKDCPSEIHPHMTKESESRPAAVETDDQLVVMDTALEVVTELSTTTPAAGILVAIERSAQTSDTIKFTATVQRVFCKRFAPTNGRLKASVVGSGVREQYGLLVQDRSGTVCEIHVPQNSTDDWCELLHQGEGRSYVFTALKVAHRTNRAKDVALFSMIDSLWRPEMYSQDTVSQDSLTDCTPTAAKPTPGCASTATKQPPVFCYILKAVGGESHCVLNETGEQMVPYNQPVVWSSNSPPTAQRTTFHVKIIFTWNRQEKEALSIAYGCYHTGRILPLHIKSTFSASIDQFQDTMVTVTDAAYQSGRWLLDGYSKVSKVRSCTGGHTPNVVIPPLSNNSALFDLVTVQGVVCGVDEQSAYIAMVCIRCKNQQLTTSTHHNLGSPLFCDQCKEVVHEPASNISLHVFLQVYNLHKWKVKIKLEQSTIERLLPVTQVPDQGFEMSCVLEKSIGPLNAVVTKRERNTQLDCDVLTLQQITCHLLHN